MITGRKIVLVRGVQAVLSKVTTSSTVAVSGAWVTGKLCHPNLERGRLGEIQDSLAKEDHELEVLYQQHRAATPVGRRIIVQGSDRFEVFSELFYKAVKVNGKEMLQGMLDLGSMASNISNTGVKQLWAAGALIEKSQSEENIVLIS